MWVHGVTLTLPTRAFRLLITIKEQAQFYYLCTS
jgi:hypothetical protein